MTSKVLVRSYSAFGGPEFSFMASDGHEAGPTDEGEYRVAYCGRHSSKRYPTWSKIPWGAKLKDEGGAIIVLFEGKWRRLSDVVELSKTDIEEYHYQLYRTRVVPSTWVFNDFGHVTCFLYKDRNRNGRRDRNEPIHGEFIHTTPVNEAQSDPNLHQPVVLEESHGCIHLQPVDIDDMIRRGYIRKNAAVVVHRYADRRIVVPRGSGHAPFEVHFFPGMKQILVLGTRDY